MTIAATLAWGVLVFAILRAVQKAIYNLYFHPLSRFPGPKLTAIGPYVEFYYDVIKDGIFIWEIEKMHEKYGEKRLSSSCPD